MRNDHHPTPALQRLAWMAGHRETLMASLLALYREQEELTESQLAAFLKGQVTTLPLLALCRRPRTDPVQFRRDVAQIATYAQVDATQLAHLVQVATAYESGTRSTPRHRVDLPYSPDDLQRLFTTAQREDVEQGGRYDARSAAVTVWTHTWTHEATRAESETMGTFYFRRTAFPTLWQIECDAAFDLEDLVLELGTLEQKALGYKIHGR